jgi:hypothetical protein
MLILLFLPCDDIGEGWSRRIGVHSRQVIGKCIEGATDMTDKKVERLHIHAPPDNLGHLTGLDPHEIIVVSLEDELLTA